MRGICGALKVRLMSRFAESDKVGESFVALLDFLVEGQMQEKEGLVVNKWPLAMLEQIAKSRPAMVEEQQR